MEPSCLDVCLACSFSADATDGGDAGRNPQQPSAPQSQSTAVNSGRPSSVSLTLFSKLAWFATYALIFGQLLRYGGQWGDATRATDADALIVLECVRNMTLARHVADRLQQTFAWVVASDNPERFETAVTSFLAARPVQGVRIVPLANHAGSVLHVARSKNFGSFVSGSSISCFAENLFCVLQLRM